MALSLDSTALTPNLEKAQAGSGLLNLALVIGNVTYTIGNFGSMLLLSTDNTGRLSGVGFGSVLDHHHHLIGNTGEGWAFKGCLETPSA